MDGGKKIMLLLAFVCCLGNLFAQNDSVFSSNKLSSFKLFSISAGKRISLAHSHGDKHFAVFLFLSPECPLSQTYLALLNSLEETYGNTVAFYGIIPGKAYSRKIIKEFASTYKIRFPLLVDSSMAFTHYVRATITPEVILVNDNNTLVYKGAVDDLLTELGKRKVKATTGYLHNAIVQSLANEKVVVKRTKAVGCKINDY